MLNVIRSDYIGLLTLTEPTRQIPKEFNVISTTSYSHIYYLSIRKARRRPGICYICCVALVAATSTTFPSGKPGGGRVSTAYVELRLLLLHISFQHFGEL